jgi:hypothetical protein
MYNPNDFYFFPAIMHMEKEIIKKGTMLYVVMLVMGEDLHIVMHILENKYGGYKPFKGGLSRDSR